MLNRALNLFRSFSIVQQYFIILTLSFIVLFICNHSWYILLLPLTTILSNVAIKRLWHNNQPPLKISGHIYNLLIGTHAHKKLGTAVNTSDTKNSCDSHSDEYSIYIRTIVERYVNVWYYPLISTDKDFPKALISEFQTILNRLNDRLKSLDPYEFARLTINLQQRHVYQYLTAYNSYRAQRKPNRISKSVVEEFSQLIGFHHSIAQNDIHSYLKAFTELLLTDLIPESLRIYSGSRLGREFITEIIVNCIFLPVFHELSKPRMLYSLIVLLWETDEQRCAHEHRERSPTRHRESITDECNSHSVTDKEDLLEAAIISDDTTKQSTPNDQPRSSHLERIIYSATIISSDTFYGSVFAEHYTVYNIQCQTKSPYISNSTHEYKIHRRFREFMNLHTRLKKNALTSPYITDLSEILQKLPVPMDSMKQDVIHQRKLELQTYIQMLISNEILNCSHDVLEFFSYNLTPNIPFEVPRDFPVERVQKVLTRTLSGVGNSFNRLLTSKREPSPFQETFQWQVSTICEKTSSTQEQLHNFVKQAKQQTPTSSTQLNAIDSQFLETLVIRPSIPTRHRNKHILSDIPLADATLRLIYTSLHSRDTVIRYQSIHDILRTLFGHFIEEFLKSQIDQILSPERITTYLTDLRTKVLWPDAQDQSKPMSNVKHRAHNACLHKIPKLLQQMVGVENVHHVIATLLDCISHEQLNKHFLCNLFDLFIEKLIPNLTQRDFLHKYVQMHSGSRS